MLIPSSFSPFMLNALNQAVAYRWSNSIPHHSLAGSMHSPENAMLMWSLSGNTEANTGDLYVTVTGSELIIKDHASLEFTCSNVSLVHKIYIYDKPTTYNISLPSLQLPHEFAKRLAEFKKILEKAHAKTA
jgi:hypothetical protein